MKPERFQRLTCDHPWTDRGRKRLRLEWPERHILPLLDITRAPVVQKHKAEYHRFGLSFGKHLAHWRGLTDHHAHFQFKIEPPTRAEARQLLARRFQLAARPTHFSAGDYNRRGAAIVTDRHMQPVG